MAEYYPLLAKAVGSLPNSTPESRRVVYERARKALIGQLRTLHPPVPEEDIERESVALDQAVERLEAELADRAAKPDINVPAPPAPVPLSQTRPVPRARPASPLSEAPAGKAEAPLLRTRLPTPRRLGTLPEPAVPEATGPADVPETIPDAPAAGIGGRGALDLDGPPRLRAETQRPIAPQPPAARAPKRRVWIMVVGIGVVVVLAAGAAFKLRQSRETVARRPAVEAAVPADSGKIADRAESPAASPSPAPTNPAASDAAAPANPDLPVAYRAALLVEAPSEPNKVKTYLGTVIWKLINVGNGPGETVGTAVEADIDLPDDKTKVAVTFEKNSDASLPASHTIKVRFTMQPGSATGDVQQISVPQLRQEDSPGGDALAGVTVPVVQNSFLIGLSPGGAETVNMKQLKDQQWIDVPMLLASGRIAKLTFEKGEAGQRDLAEAMTAWSKS